MPAPLLTRPPRPPLRPGQPWLRHDGRVHGRRRDRRPGTRRRGHRFAMQMPGQGYNLLVMGPEGSGKYTAIRQYLDQQAACRPVPDDWCYVHNFEDARRPRAIRLPAGRGRVLRARIGGAGSRAGGLPSRAPRERRVPQSAAGPGGCAQEPPRWGARRLRSERLPAAWPSRATPVGFGVAPLRDNQVSNGRLRSSPGGRPGAHASGDVGGRRGADRAPGHVAEMGARAPARGPGDDRETRPAGSRPADRRGPGDYADLAAVRLSSSRWRPTWSSTPRSTWRRPRPSGQTRWPARRRRGPVPPLPRQPPGRQRRARARRSSTRTSRPSPTWSAASSTRPAGRAGHRLHAHQGGGAPPRQRRLPGARRAAAAPQPFAWEALKRALRSRRDAHRVAGRPPACPTVSLEPEPIPLDVKVVLIGDRLIYYLLPRPTPTSPSCSRSRPTSRTRCRGRPRRSALCAAAGDDRPERALRPFDRAAVAASIEQAARLAGDAERLSTHIGRSTTWCARPTTAPASAGRDGRGGATSRGAIDAQRRRALADARALAEETRRGTMLHRRPTARRSGR